MESLSEIIGKVRKGSVIKLFLGKGESYVGQVRDITSHYIALSPFGGKESKGDKVYFAHPRFKGRKVEGYEEFRSVHTHIPRTVYVPTIHHTLRVPCDRDMSGMGGPFRNSLDAELADEDEKRESALERIRKKQEIESFDRPIGGGSEY